MSFTRLGRTCWQDLLFYLREVDPEGVAEQGAYVIFEDEIPANHPALRCSRGASAFTGLLLDVQLQDVLIAMGRWIGRGPAIVFCDRYPFRRACAGLLHEWAHVQDRRCGCEYTCAMLIRAERSKWPHEIAALVDSAIANREAMTPQVPFHGVRWLRVVSHLAYRSGLNAAMTLTVQEVVGAYYSTAEMEAFERALGDERERLVALPISEVLRLDMPEALLALGKEFAKSDDSREAVVSELRQ